MSLNSVSTISSSFSLHGIANLSLSGTIDQLFLYFILILYLFISYFIVSQPSPRFARNAWIW